MMKLTVYASESKYEKPEAYDMMAESIEEAQALVLTLVDESEPEVFSFIACNVYADSGEYLGAISQNGKYWQVGSKYGKEYKPE